MIEISWFGDFSSVHAFSTINRKLSEAFESLGHAVYRNSHYDKNGKITPVYLIFTYEYNFNIPVRHQLNLGMMTWEFGGANSVPEGWKNGAKSWDLTISICDWTTRVFHNNGMKNLVTLPMGVDEKEFYPARTSSDLFRVLWAGGSDKRHGWDLAIRAFREAFPNDNTVQLILKVDTNYPGFYDFVAQFNDNRIIYNHGNLKSMSEFYNSGDCFLYPVRGAGPGLLGMEAMACGLPVIVTDGGGPLSYSKYAHRIPFSVERTVHHCKTDSKEPYWMEPDFNKLVEALRRIRLEKDYSKRLGNAASDYIRTTWTWKRSAENLEYILKQALKPVIVSIVILTHDRKEPALGRCIDSIMEHTQEEDDPGFELVVVDNASSNWEYPVDSATKHPYNKIIRNQKNLGVSGGRNVGMQNSSGDYIMFLDDDAIITKKGWLKELLSYFKDSSVGIVGQTGTYIPEGRWGEFWESKGVTEADVVQGYCQMFPKELVNKIGYLDEKFGKFWHEDADWCLRIREAGYKVIDVDNVGIYHLGSCSGDDGTYVTKINYLKNKWEGKPWIRVPKQNWSKPYIKHE